MQSRKLEEVWRNLPPEADALVPSRSSLKVHHIPDLLPDVADWNGPLEWIDIGAGVAELLSSASAHS
ncbi:hypothetical protein [Kordiimonas aquimaris]|uniref:hypothetical protein n=1 Tax=Kordiimonas aquimaris TaxID=707591 RepID=UPI0021D064D5|nr:hypothetical protein [Kordiimonas aquimaris]